MKKWNENNRACTTTWTTLKILDQNHKVFKESGSVMMDKLTFWNQASSEEMRKIQAASLANQIDNVFRLIRGAKYEEGITPTNAINEIIDILLDGNKTISDLASTADKNYLFWGENENE